MLSRSIQHQNRMNRRKFLSLCIVLPALPKVVIDIAEAVAVKEAARPIVGMFGHCYGFLFYEDRVGWVIYNLHEIIKKKGQHQYAIKPNVNGGVYRYSDDWFRNRRILLDVSQNNQTRWSAKTQRRCG